MNDLLAWRLVLVMDISRREFDSANNRVWTQAPMNASTKPDCKLVNLKLKIENDQFEGFFDKIYLSNLYRRIALVDR